MKTMEKIVSAAVAAGAVMAIGWMAVRFVSAVVFLLSPLRDANWSSAATTAADKSLEASLPLFLLDNGSVAVSDSSGYVAKWDAYHAHFAGLWAAASEATTALAVIAVTVAVLLLCIRLFRGIPFSQSITRWVGGAGAALIVGSALAQLFSWFSRQEMIATIAVDVHNNGWRRPSSAIAVDIVPLACGAVLLIVAMAFRVGTRLQRDTEGLV
ncbi:hypothetical protein [Parafrigoribacterium soli]|uniref:hypothetical protein n=1 Tax=Parafrigoribacterium soli TaxID=3144663 RepID=UPI0032EACC0C